MATIKRKPAVFLDRDGTIIRWVEVLVDPSQIELIPGAATAIAELNRRGFFVFVVTNQPIIEKGLLTEKGLEKIHEMLQRKLAEAGARIDAFYSCPHQYRKRGQCLCRKPGLGLVYDAQRDFPVDMEKSWFIGDRLRDIETGRRAGVKTILVETGGDDDDDIFFPDVRADFEAKDLHEAAHSMLMAKKITQAILLCGGKGTRLLPHTSTMPKPMIPILGHPLTEWNILQFKKYGVTNFLMALHAHPEALRDYFGDGRKWGVRISYSYEPAQLGTAGAMKLLELDVHDEFFVIYGDMLALIDYAKFEGAWREKPANAIGMQRVQKLEDYEDADVAELDADGKFLAIHPKPHSGKYPNAYRMRGASIMKKEILQYVPRGAYYEIGKDLLPDVILRGEKFYAYECDDYSKGIDTEQKWKETEEYLQKHNINFENLL